MKKLAGIVLRIILVIAAAIILFAVVYFDCFGCRPQSIKGDMDGDGEVTITDYTMIRLYILGKDKPEWGIGD